MVGVFVDMTLGTAFIYTLQCLHRSRLSHGPRSSTRNKAHHCLIARPNLTKAIDYSAHSTTRNIQHFQALPQLSILK